MNFPDNEATRMTEVVMRTLCNADVLKPDQPNHPHHYNRAFSSVHDALTLRMGVEEPRDDFKQMKLRSTPTGINTVPAPVESQDTAVQLLRKLVQRNAIAPSQIQVVERWLRNNDAGYIRPRFA